MRRWSAAWLPDPISAHVALGLGAAPCALLGLSGTGAPRDCRAGLPPLNCLGGPVFLPSSAISFGFKHISTGAGSCGWF